MFSGLRIVLTATAITIALILCAFGAIGMLMMARTPQQTPIADRFDPVPPRVQQSDTQITPEPEPQTPTSVHEKTLPPEPETADLEKKAVKTLRVIAPPPAPEQKPEAKTEIAGDPKKVSAEPETTGTLPPAASPQQQTAPRAVPPRTPRRQQNVRRPTQEVQNENPLLQLFGIKKYR